MSEPGTSTAPSTFGREHSRRFSHETDVSTVHDTYTIQEPIPLQEVTSFREQIREQLPPGILATRSLSIQPYPSKEGVDLEAVNSRIMAHHTEKRPIMHYVNWDQNDPECPYNWPSSTRWLFTIIYAGLVVSAAFGSSVITGRLYGVVESFGCTEEVAILQVSLMVFGFMLGPLLWSPLSELFGRKPVYVIALFIYTIFNIPCAVAKNIETVLVCRFFSGFFASCSLTLAGGSISDLFPTETRGSAIAYFAAAPYAGPVLGPLVGGWISVGTQNWRWIYWVSLNLQNILSQH
jgi:multidrug resistance protein